MGSLAQPQVRVPRGHAVEGRRRGRATGTPDCGLSPAAVAGLRRRDRRQTTRSRVRRSWRNATCRSGTIRAPTRRSVIRRECASPFRSGSPLRRPSPGDPVRSRIGRSPRRCPGGRSTTRSRQARCAGPPWCQRSRVARAGSVVQGRVQDGGPAGAVRLDLAQRGFAQVVPQMPAVGDLHGMGQGAADGLGVGRRKCDSVENLTDPPRLRRRTAGPALGPGGRIASYTHTS
jgi:hypothetical protein